MHRWTSLVLGLLLAAALTTIFLKAPRPNAAAAPPAASADARELPPAPPPSATPPVAPEAEPVHGEDVTPAPNALVSLPASAPKSVTFGVILLRYAGAEGAPPGTRSKGDARKLAESLMPEAQTDFSSAVARGDRGSSSDAGRIPTDVLEPALEYALFTMKPGQVHPEPLDTPKGYWIVKRIK